MRPWRVLATLAAALAALAPGCATGDDGDDLAGRRLRIVTTVSPLTSLVANVAGDRATVTGVVPEGTNSHTFEPPPSVAEALSDADVIFLNGLRLEDPTLALAKAHKRSSARLVQLGDEVLPADDYVYDFSFPKSGGKPNPHLWTDPTYARRYVEVIHDVLYDVESDEDARRAYTTNRDRLIAKLHDFDVALREATASVPREQRKLLTYHDAYAYFARTYDWTVIGAIQVESFDDPTPKELATLIDQVRRERVPAIFGSEVFASPVLEQIGREAGVRYVDDLRDDDLPGKPGDAEHSWLGLMRFDYVTMVRALGGDPSALERLDVSDVAPDRARYPQ